MASLTDLFNPTFFMVLGILVLIVALLVVYFESKTREQNHKIASMLSLVSTLAEDMNGVKMGLTHLTFKGGRVPDIQLRENLGNLEKGELIEVSDDEESSDNDEEEEIEESDNDESDNDESMDDNSEESNYDIKIVKLQVSDDNIDTVNESYEESNNLEFGSAEDLTELDADFEPDVDNQYVEEMLDLKYESDEKDEKDEKNFKEPDSHLNSDLKMISINLGEEYLKHDENIDYKKLQLAKLRSIAVEKGLTNNSDASKLKKPELLKLLGAE
jgi:TusA-related sulfurtransferase